MIHKGTNYLSREQQKQLDEILKICNNAIEDQKKREKTLGYGLDDYTEGRTVGAANLARRIKRVVYKENI